MSYDCPERFNQQNNKQKSNSHGAKVNHVAAETVQEGPEIMMGRSASTLSLLQFYLILELHIHLFHKHLLEFIAFH